MYQPTKARTSPLWLFEHLFGDTEGYLVTFTGRQSRLEDPDARHNELTATQQRSYRYPASAELAANYSLAESKRERDAYYGVHLFREPGNRRASNAMGSMSCLWLDEDEGCYPVGAPQPTAIVYSSETRRHLYWRLTRALSAEWIVDVNRRIAAFAGGDPGKAGLSSVLRVPGTFNFKRYPQVDPVQLRITGVPPWEPEVLDQAIPLLPEPEPKRRHGDEGYCGPPLDLIDDYIEPSGVEVLAEVPDARGRKFAIICPWVEQHSGGDRTGTYLGQFDSGAVWFCCRHEHCQGRDLRNFKEKTFPKGLVRWRVPRKGRRGTVVVRLG